MKIFQKIFEELPLVFLVTIFLIFSGLLFYFQAPPNTELADAATCNCCPGNNSCDFCVTTTKPDGTSSSDYLCGHNPTGCTPNCGSACCSSGQSCVGGKCCMPDCYNKKCGSDGCNGACSGTCPVGQTCDPADGQCKCTSCSPTCPFGSCAASGPNFVCENGACVCKPNCTGKECGPDGCGGSCGDCTVKNGPKSTCNLATNKCTPCVCNFCGDCKGTCDGVCETAYKCNYVCPVGYTKDGGGRCCETPAANGVCPENGSGSTGYHTWVATSESNCEKNNTTGAFRCVVSAVDDEDWTNITDCGEARHVTGPYCFQDNPTVGTEVNGCSDGGAACTHDAYFGAVDVCGLHGDAKVDCRGSYIVTTVLHYGCRGSDGNAACVPTGTTETYMPCGPANDTEYTYCSKGVKCTVKASNPGKCFYLDQKSIPCSCPSGQWAQCNGAQCSCVPQRTGGSGSSSATCTGGSQVGGCEAPKFSLTCEGPCDEDTGTTPPPDGCQDGQSQSCEGSGTRSCSNGAWGECVCPEGEQSPSYKCVAGSCAQTAGCGKTASGCSVESCTNTTAVKPGVGGEVVANSDYCSATAGSGLATFSWDFITSKTGSAQTSWQFQISTASNFSSLVYDSGKQDDTNNLQQMAVVPALTAPTSACAPNCNYINYGVEYFWRIKVWDASGAVSDWVLGQPTDGYTYPYAHPAPIVSYSYPESIFKGTPAIFTDTSKCYRDDGSSYNCKDYLVNSSMTPTADSVLCDGIAYYAASGDTTKYCYGWWLNNNYANSNTSPTPTRVESNAITVKAISTEVSAINATKDLTIRARTVRPVVVTSLAITQSGRQMYVTATPATATDKSVMWSINNGSGVAVIDPLSGWITGQTAGTVTVIATALDGSGVSASKTVDVAVDTTTTDSATAISVAGSSFVNDVVNGQSLTMFTIPSPAGTVNPSVTWSVTTLGKASINSEGLLVAGSPADTFFTYTVPPDTIASITRKTHLQVCDDIACCSADKTLTVGKNPPKVYNLKMDSLLSYYCSLSGSSDSGYTYARLSWVYTGSVAGSNYRQKAYQLQISKDPTFTDIFYDSGTKPYLANNPSTTRINIYVYPSSYTAADSAATLHIHYGEAYYIRLRAQEYYNGAWSAWTNYLDSYGYQTTYSYPYEHQAPKVSATLSSTSVASGQTINFTNTSKCYDSDGTENNCEDLGTVNYKWAFGDSSPDYTSSDTGNTSHMFYSDTAATYYPKFSVCDLPDYPEACCYEQYTIGVGGNEPPIVVPDEPPVNPNDPPVVVPDSPITPNPYTISDKGNYCAPHAVNFRWNYSDVEKDTQSGWQFQLSTTPNFESANIVFEQLANNTVNAVSVPVSTSTCLKGSNCISYNTSYYARVKVFEYKAGSLDIQGSTWYYYGNGTDALAYKFPFSHPAPRVFFNYIAEGRAFFFQDYSVCYTYASGVIDSKRCYALNGTNWTWTFENNATRSGTGLPGTMGNTERYTYTSKGTYAPTLTVCDDTAICCPYSSSVSAVDDTSTTPLWKEISPF